VLFEVIEGSLIDRKVVPLVSRETQTDQPPGAWNLSCLYDGDDDPQIADDIATIEATVNAFVAKHAGLIAASPMWRWARAIADFRGLQWRFLVEPTIDEQLGPCRPMYYWMLRDASESTEAAQAKMQELTAWYQGLQSKLEFFLQLFDGMPQSRRRVLLKSPWLRPYRAWLTQRFMLPVSTPTPAQRAAAGVATANAAQLTNQLSVAFGSAGAMVWKDGTQQRVSLPGIVSLATSPIEQEWQSAAAALPVLYNGLKGQAFVELTTALAARTAEANLLGGSVEAVRCATDTLPADTLDGLVGAVMDPNTLTVAHKCYALKATLMGGQLPFARRRATYGVLKKYTWPEAIGLIRTFFERTSPTFLAEFDRALANGYIDAQARDGKTPRTACWWGPDMQPMLAVNFIGDINNISQIVHEFGHYMAALAASRSCNGLSYNTRIPKAETDGIGLQLLVPLVVADKLGDDEQSRLVAMMAQLETIMSTIFLQCAGTAFEQRLYKDSTLTVDRIVSLFTEYMHMLFGDGVAIDDLTGLNWINWPQLRQGFYNYGYVLAGMVAVVIRQRYQTDPADTIRQINRLMAAGSKATLTDIYEAIGITLGPDLWRECISAIADQVDQATALAQQLGLIPAT